MKKEKSELTELIERLKLNPKDTSLFPMIGNVLRQYSMQDKWIPTVINKNDGSLIFHEVDGRQFIPVFSDEEYIQSKGQNVLVTSINKIIAVLFSNPKLGGLEINPFSMGLCIETWSLIQIIFGEYEKYQLEKKDWGLGIPEYSPADLLDEKSILDFAIQAVSEYCNKEKIKVLFATNDLDACINLLIRDGEKLAFVLVEGDIYPKTPELSFERRKKLFERSRQFGFDCYYASVGFMPADLLRADKSIALRGDAYYIRFEGLQKVENVFN